MKTLAAVLLGLGLVLVPAAPGYAHNTLESSDPEDGASVEQPPDQVRLTFSAELDPLNIEVEVDGPDGASVADGEPDFDGETVTVPVAATLAGDYQISYRVFSSDGDWVEGEIDFTVAEGQSPTPSPSPTPGPSPPAATAVPAGGTGPRAWVWAAGLVVVAVGAGYGAYRLRRRTTG